MGATDESSGVFQMKICLACDHRFEALDWRCPKCEFEPPRKRSTLLFAPALSECNGGFKANYFSELANLESGHFWFRNRNRLLIWAMQKYFPEARKFLEVGCGTGFVSSGLRPAFPSLEICGGELFLDGIEFARSRLPGAALYQMDAVQIPFEAEFDVVGAFDVLEHIEQDETALAQLHQALRPGGGLLLTVPQHHALWSSADVSACHKRRYAQDELVGKVKAAGFETVKVTSFVSLLLPLMWASRHRAVKAGDIASNSELRINQALNGLLEAVLRIETWFIRWGAAFPCGGSLLLVGQKATVPSYIAVTSPKRDRKLPERAITCVPA
jgi:SAM-dependent methyltransferase